MRNVAILTPVLENRDAVGNDVVGMWAALNQAGFQAKIFADTWIVSDTPVEPLTDIREFITSPSDILIYHYSIGWDAGLQVLEELDCRKVIRYHNVTPPEFFVDISDDHVNACREGRAQLKKLLNIQDAIYLCASEYNLHDLSTIGIHPEIGAVLPPFHRIDQQRSLEADLSILDKYLDGKFNVLMVGRVVPNKGHLTLIDAFNLYHKSYNPQSRLLIVGKEDPRLETYNRVLHKKVEELELETDVIFTGGVSSDALKAYYLIANAFMITSDHEGFCVPLVEAMSRKIPIVAYGSTAIPFTVGDTGLIWEQPDPHLLAGSLHKIATERSIQSQLGELGWKRYQAVFSNEKIESQLIQFVKSLL